MVREPWPAYVPAGYRFAFKVVGEDAAGFWGSRDQVLLTYVSGSDPALPLAVFAAADADAELLGTEQRDGVLLDIGVADATAVYHDGIWQLGSGPEARQAGQVIVHWSRDDVHSITIAVDGTFYAVRGARSKGVSLDELARVARSLTLD
jgi:hypothetical protein